MKENSAQIIADKIFQFSVLENKRVLEVGCGDGRITSLLVGKSEEMIAIEPNEVSLKKAREKINDVNFQLGSGENLKFPDHFFDVVIFTLSLHHQDSQSAICEARRVLKNDGLVLVIEPVDTGEIEQLFGFLSDEKAVKQEAQKAIMHGGFTVLQSEIFNAQWEFKNKEELCSSLFELAEVPFDEKIAVQLIDFIGDKMKDTPIKLTDTMIIQTLGKTKH